MVFGVSAVAWLTALSRVPLSVAHPFNAIGYLVILIASILALHERANVLTWVGSLLVVSGLFMVVLTQAIAGLRLLDRESTRSGWRIGDAASADHPHLGQAVGPGGE